MGKILLVLAIVFLNFADTSLAQPPLISDELKELANKTVMNIYYDIVSLKDRYPELKDFGEQSKVINKHGILAINYSYTQVDPTLGEIPYAFGLTVTTIDDTIFQTAKEYAFNITFPLLGMKFAGYKIVNFKSKQFDIEALLQKHGQALWDYQQNYMPVRLNLKPAKESYQTGEDIGFEVTLTNTTNVNMKIRDLTADTLFFVYDNKTWGAWEMSPGVSTKEVVLKANQSMSKVFRGNGFHAPKEFEIYCSYGMTFKGVKPAASLKVKVVKKKR